MDKLYYSIGEVAGILNENVPTVRFWANSFPDFIRPKRNAKGNRMFTAADVEMFRNIAFLLRTCGMTLEGAARRLRDEGQKVSAGVKVLDSLKSIREQLLEVRKSLI